MFENLNFDEATVKAILNGTTILISMATTIISTSGRKKANAALDSVKLADKEYHAFTDDNISVLVRGCDDIYPSDFGNRLCISFNASTYQLSELSGGWADKYEAMNFVLRASSCEKVFVYSNGKFVELKPQTLNAENNLNF